MNREKDKLLENENQINKKKRSQRNEVSITVQETKTDIKKKLDKTFVEKITDQEIDEVLGDKRVKQRITLLRHYPYNDETEVNKKIIEEYNRLLLRKLRQDKLSENEIEKLILLEKQVDALVYNSFSDIPEKYLNYKRSVENIFKSGGRILLVYPKDGKTRVKKSGEDLKKQFGFDNTSDIGLKGSDKKQTLGKIYVDMATNFAEELNKLLKENKGQYENIVIVGNRSYSFSFNLCTTGDREISIRQSEENFESDGYNFTDYVSEKGTLPKDYQYIIVTHENYNNLKKLFPEIEHNSIIDFQNKLNVYFLKNPELNHRYEYLYSDIEELRVYCLLNLIKFKKVETLNKLFKDKEFRILVEKVNFEKLLNNQEKSIIHYYLQVYPKVLEVKVRSLDLRIKNGEDIEPHFNFDDKNYEDNNLQLIKSGKPIKYIEGKAGAGKSFLLSHLVELSQKENFKNNGDNKPYYPIYFSLSSKNLNDLKSFLDRELDNIENKSDYEIVFLFDSIDESTINGEERKDLDKILLNLSEKGKVIITSRNGYLYNYNLRNEDELEQKSNLNLKQEIIEIKDFTEDDIKGYLEKYFPYDDKKRNDVLSILTKLNGAGNNPLILSMVCEIVKDGKLNLKTGEKIDLVNINIVDIYNEIVRIRLFDNSEKPERRGHKNDLLDEMSLLNTKKEFLAKLAYEFLYNNVILTEEYLHKFILTNKYGVYIKKDLESLNLIFRRSEDGKYFFVHHSFFEYFVAYYIFNLINKISEEEGGALPYLLDIYSLKGYSYDILEKLLYFIKGESNFKEKVIKDIIDKLVNNNSIDSSKEIYILSILNKNLANTIFNKYVITYKTSYKDLVFIEGIIRSNVKGLTKYIVYLLSKINFDLKKNSGGIGQILIYFNDIVKLMTRSGLGKNLYKYLYNEIYIKGEKYLLTPYTFNILYDNSENKDVLIKITKNYINKRLNFFRWYGHYYGGDINSFFGEILYCEYDPKKKY
nr:NACHT domain-containing protein [Candidatus Gracilibacteria bacterium]